MTNHWADLQHCKAILVEGSNVAENHVMAMKWIRKAQQNGAVLIHVDPRFTRTSAGADIFARIRPGTDVAFLGAVIHHLLERGLFDADYVAIPHTVTIGAGQTSASLVVTPIADADIEGPETVVVALEPNPDYGLGLQTSATVTIAGEQLPAMTLSLVGSPVVGAGREVQLQILLGEAAPAGGVIVTITSDDPGTLTVGPPATAEAYTKPRCS